MANPRRSSRKVTIMKNKLEIEYRKLPLAKLKVHPKVQRPFNIEHARNIAKNWHPIACNPLTVIRMTSGDRGYYIIDGQHTFHAAKAVGLQMIDCKVIPLKTHAEMNAVFHLINTGVRRVSPLDSFGMNARNDTRTDDARANQILEAVGLSTGKGGDNHTIRAAQQVRNSYKRLGVELFPAAAALWKAIADSGSPIREETIKSITDLVARYGCNDSTFEDMREVLEDDYATLHAQATSQCIGTSLNAAPHILTGLIETAVFGHVVGEVA